MRPLRDRLPFRHAPDSAPPVDGMATRVDARQRAGTATGPGSHAGRDEPQQTWRPDRRSARSLRPGPAPGDAVRDGRARRGSGRRGLRAQAALSDVRGLVMCYLAAWPFLGWALLIMAGVDADETRVAFLVVEALAVCLSVHGLRRKYRRD